MMNATIEQGLKPYAVGEKLRALRLKKKMGLVELGKHTGLSPALLSKLERSKLFPTLPTLLRIALVFSVRLDFFFAPRKEPVVAIVRKSERLRFPDRPGTREVAYFFESLDFPATDKKLSAYCAEFQAVKLEKQKPHQHPGVEFLYVLKGGLGMRIGADDHRLEAGDSIYFDSSIAHSYARLSKGPCAALVVSVGA